MEEGCVAPRGFSRESIFLDCFLASSTACIPLACNLFPESLQSLVSGVSSPTLSLTLLPPPYKHSCDYIGPMQRTQHNHPIPKSLAYSHLHSILPTKVNTLTGFRDQDVDTFGGHYSGYHTGLAMYSFHVSASLMVIIYTILCYFDFNVCPAHIPWKGQCKFQCKYHRAPTSLA